MDWDNARRTFQTAVIWIAVAALAFVLWHIRQGVLLVFGAVVLAVLLSMLASFISDWTRLPHGPSLALWTAVAYLAIHVFEGYVTEPMIDRYFVTIPPALILTGIVASDLMFGTIGVIMAAPITVVVYMAVKMIYVENPLGERHKPAS